MSDLWDKYLMWPMYHYSQVFIGKSFKGIRDLPRKDAKYPANNEGHEACKSKLRAIKVGSQARTANLYSAQCSNV
jgi:hypothetical protein